MRKVRGMANSLHGLRLVLAITLTLGLSGPWAGLVLAAAGDLDPRFGDTGLGPGKAFAEIFGYDQAYGVAIQGDGRIVVVGAAAPGAEEPSVFTVVRFISDGTLDPTFGSGGKVTTQILEQRNEARAVAIQPDGKIVVAGYSERGAEGLFDENFALARYNPDGGLDPEFGGGGVVLTDFGSLNDQGNAVALQPDGKIVVVGGTTRDGGNMALARYEPDGTLDLSFGYGGQLVFDGLRCSEPYGGSPRWSWPGAAAVALQPDGKIVVVGKCFLDRDSFGVARFTPGGAPDPGFGTNGMVLTSFGGQRGDAAYAVDTQADGKIVVGGTMGGSATAPSDNLYALARYNPNGSLDTSFSSDGKVTTSVAPGGGGGDDLYTIAIQADGKIVGAGMSFTPTGATQFGVARYNPNGSLDTSFSGDGKLTTNFGGEELASAVTIQPDGNIVVAGQAELNSGSRFFVLARYLAQ